MNDYNISTIQKRVASFIIDDIVVGIFLMIIFYDQINQLGIQASQEGMDPKKIQDIVNVFLLNAIPIVLAVKILYHSLLIWQNGMTIGKYITKIKVVDINSGNKPSFVQALFRGNMRIVSEIPLYAGFILAFFIPKRQTFHDKVSNCVVVDV
jgi:uncharacterized RDD family membrane protein YckC